ncbi:helix-turn-helix domain-containing protein [Enterobacter asburiae]|uniref:helix-turn-helix domain-containing protein n=1 Tax=Enterobacter asburiae TaxID=61645 RepID=UPI0021D2567A|nr:helix-turn-helix transcriptional regulator [Enterobacter asburiae]
MKKNDNLLIIEHHCHYTSINGGSCMATGAERKKNIIKNISYLISTRGENKKSFSERSGVKRSTLYKILDGKVNNVQKGTVTKIANFFGVTCEQLEEFDLEDIEIKNQTMSVGGNKNPAAAPVIPERDIISSMKKSIGELIVKYPTTYFFRNDSNVIAMKVETRFSTLYYPGDLILIKRRVPADIDDIKICKKGAEMLLIRDSNQPLNDGDDLIGIVVEERCF